MLNLNQIIKAVETLASTFPNLPISNAVNQAKELINSGGTPQDIMSQININKQGINGLYEKYGNNPKARMMLNQIGMTPEQLRDSSINLLNTNTGQKTNNAKTSVKSSNKGGFTRL